MKKSAILSASMLVALFALTAISPVAAAAGSISIRDLVQLSPNFTFPGSSSLGYRPNIVNVKLGSVVTFTNVGLDNHTVTSFQSRVPPPPQFPLPITIPKPDGVIDSSPSVPNFSVEGGNFADAIHPGQTFNVDTSSIGTGTIMIFCKFHPWMTGAIVVSLDGPSGASVRISDTVRLTNQPPFFSPFAGSASWGFISRTTTVKQGTLLTWTNDGFIPHTVTSGLPGAPDMGSAFNSGFGNDPRHFIFPNMTFSVDTSKLAPGVYPYHCDLHEWMQGTLIVLG